MRILKLKNDSEMFTPLFLFQCSLRQVFNSNISAVVLYIKRVIKVGHHNKGMKFVSAFVFCSGCFLRK